MNVHPLLAAALVATSARAVRDGRAEPLDRTLRERLTALRTPARDAAVRVGTDLGSLYGVGIVAGLFATAGRPRTAGRVAAAGAAAWSVAQAAKPLLPRERPYQADGAERLVVEPAGTSWPSGHAAVAAALAVTVGAGRGPFVRRLLDTTALAVGASRVYAGVHHPSDVAAGLGLGTLSARALRRVLGRVS